VPVLGIAGNTLSRREAAKGGRRKKASKQKRRQFSQSKPQPTATDIYKPSARRGSWHIYVLKLEHDCYYVGITARSEIHWRYRQHNYGRGAQWTRMHPPIGVYETYWIGQMTEAEAVVIENQKTLEMIRAFGVDQVRGGQLVRTNRDLHRARYKLLLKSATPSHNDCHKHDASRLVLSKPVERFTRAAG
jgi:predicted GIY-YIG superfamily endonuclease